jgi:hypothetical protein
LQFLFFDFGACRFQRGLRFARGFGVLGAFLLGHLEKHARLFEALAQALMAGELTLDLVLFLEDRLRDLLVVPELGFAGLFEELLLSGGQLGEVKDASRAFPRGIRNRSIVREVR